MPEETEIQAARAAAAVKRAAQLAARVLQAKAIPEALMEVAQLQAAAAVRALLGKLETAALNRVRAARARPILSPALRSLMQAAVVVGAMIQTAQTPVRVGRAVGAQGLLR
jgi:hypothetical protein